MLRAPLPSWILLAFVGGWPITGHAAQEPLAFSTGREPADSADLRGRARDAQARFERFRRNNLHMAWGGWGGHCDEVVGRMCMRYDEGEWEPVPEPLVVAAARNRLLSELADLSDFVPGDVWIRGQQIRYLAEVDRWEDALGVATACRGGGDGWCEALTGYVQHGAGRYPDSERSFRTALGKMDPAVAAEWQNPGILLRDGEDPLLHSENALPPDRMVDRAWALADPLFVHPGNDRLTAHYSRYVVSRLREGTRITYGMPWGTDLQELLVRYGWEIGWERTMPGPGESRSRGIVGHHHPDAMTYMPPTDVLRFPERTELDGWSLDPKQPHSSYAPLYAPHITRADVQIARFWRNDSVHVVAAYRMTPPARDAEAGHEEAHLAAFAPIPDDLPVKAGLFLLPAEGGPPYQATRPARAADAFAITVPAGRYMLSVEALSEARATASRARVGLTADTLPPDVPVLSDALLFDADPGVPASLGQARDQAWPGTGFRVDERVGVAWELSGLSRVPEVVTYTLTVEKRDRGLFESVGAWVGLFGGGPELELSWSEETDGGARRHFRATDLEFPELESGQYRLRLEATLPGRGTMVSERVLTVLD